jgi:hypothetical protein
MDEEPWDRNGNLARKVFVPPAVWGAPKNREGMRRLDPCWAEEAERARLGRGRAGPVE